MNWYLVHTKPRQEKCALLNLQQQGYECYLPVISAEKLRQGELVISDEPLFPRYLFIQLGTDDSAKSWGPIRSTRGVNRLVKFGQEPARVDDGLVRQLRAHEKGLQAQPQRLFTPGELVRLVSGPFAALDAIYEMPDGESRVMVLIELLNKPVRMSVAPANLRKIG